MTWSPCLIRAADGAGRPSIKLGHPLLDDYLAFVGARARTNTWLAVAYDLKVFFSVIAKEPAAVTTADVFTFLKEQRSPRRGAKVVRLEDGEAGLAARTFARRLSSLSGLYVYLVFGVMPASMQTPSPGVCPPAVREPLRPRRG